MFVTSKLGISECLFRILFTFKLLVSQFLRRITGGEVRASLSGQSSKSLQLRKLPIQERVKIMRRKEKEEILFERILEILERYKD